MFSGLIFSILLILPVACNRYGKTTAPEKPDNGFYSKLLQFSEQLTTSLTENNVPEVMHFYADDYLFDGRSKQDVYSFYSGLAAIPPDSVKITISSMSAARQTFSFRLRVYADVAVIDNSTALLDTTIVEHTLSELDNFLFIGNREEADTSKDRRVLIEMFTGLDCINCVYVKTAINILKQQYGDRFFYIEYHRLNKFDFGNSDLYFYYGIRSIPTGVIQGSSKLRGGDSVNESLLEYEYALSQYLGIEAEFFFADFSYTVVESDIRFSITITTEKETLPEDLQFRYALIERESSYEYEPGLTLRNIVIHKGSRSLTGERAKNYPHQENGVTDIRELQLDVSFRKPSFDFNDPALTFWIQTITRIYNEDVCKVHNVEEFAINF